MDAVPSSKLPYCDIANNSGIFSAPDYPYGEPGFVQVKALHSLAAEIVRLRPLLSLGGAFDIYIGIIAKMLLTRYAAMMREYTALQEAVKKGHPFASPALLKATTKYAEECQLDTLMQYVQSVYERLRKSFVEYVTVTCGSGSGIPTWDDVERMVLASRKTARGVSKNSGTEVAALLRWRKDIYGVAEECGITTPGNTPASLEASRKFLTAASRLSLWAPYLGAVRVLEDTMPYSTADTPEERAAQFDTMTAQLPQILGLDITSRYIAYDVRDATELNTVVPAADARRVALGASPWDITAGYSALFADPIVNDAYTRYVTQVWPNHPSFWQVPATPTAEPAVHDDSAQVGSMEFARLAYALRYALFVNGTQNFALDPAVQALTSEFTRNCCRALLPTDYTQTVVKQLVPQIRSGMTNFGAPMKGGLLQVDVAAPIAAEPAPYAVCDRTEDREALVCNTHAIKTLGPVLCKLAAVAPLVISDYHVRINDSAQKAPASMQTLVANMAHVYTALGVLNNLMQQPPSSSPPPPPSHPAHLLRSDGKGIATPRAHYARVAGIELADLPEPPPPAEETRVMESPTRGKRSHDAMDVDVTTNTVAMDVDEAPGATAAAAEDQIPDEIVNRHFSKLALLVDAPPVDVTRQLTGLDNRILVDLYQLGTSMISDEAWGPACAVAFGSILIGIEKWLEEPAASGKPVGELPWNGIEEARSWMLGHAEGPSTLSDDAILMVVDALPESLFRDIIDLFDTAGPEWMEIVACIIGGIGHYCVDGGDSRLDVPAKRAKI